MPEHTERRRNVALAVAVTIDGRPQYRIAAEAGVNPSTFAAYITGRLTPNADQRAAVAGALGREVGELFEAVRTDA